jgi:hypothetical protein
VSGRLLFGALGLLVAIPMLRRMRRRRGFRGLPAGAVALAVVFAFSSFVVGPAVTAGDGGSGTPARSVPSVTPPVSPSAHEDHHR